MIPDGVRARDLVGYGRTPPAFEWPDGAKVVVNLVLVYEEGSEYSVMWGDDRNDGWGEYADPGVQPPQRDPGTESHYEYGSRAGVWRLARIFDRAGVPVTVSAAAVALELNPAVAEWMHERDHDLMGHGWRWTEAWTLLAGRGEASRSRAPSRRTSGCSAAARSAGTRAAGRARTRAACCSSWAASSTTRRARPTTCPTTSRRSRDAMLVVPYSKTYNDSRFLMNPGFASPRDFLDTMVMGLDELLREGDERRTMMTVAVHARWSGQAARASALRQFIEHAQSTPGVSFMRRCDIARWWLERYPARVRCVVFTGVGGPEVVAVEDRPDPSPGKFEVVIAPAYRRAQPGRRAAARGPPSGAARLAGGHPRHGGGRHRCRGRRGRDGVQGRRPRVRPGRRRRPGDAGGRGRARAGGGARLARRCAGRGRPRGLPDGVRRPGAAGRAAVRRHRCW